MIKYIVLDFGMVLAYPTTGNWHITPKFLELIDINKIDKNELKKAFENNKYKPYDGIKEELLNLSQKYKLLLLSDNWPDGIDSLKLYGVYELFSKVYISSIYGQLKRDGDFFDNPIRDYNIAKGEAIFIDDNENLLEIAKNKGLEVRLMDREGKIENSKFKIINNLKNI